VGEAEVKLLETLEFGSHPWWKQMGFHMPSIPNIREERLDSFWHGRKNPQLTD